MDELIFSLNKFEISNDKKELDSDLDYVTNQFNKQTLNDPDREWDIIKENYSKIKYLKRYLSNFSNENLNILDTDSYHEKFIFVLGQCMGSIDKTNMNYLRSIDWEADKIKIKDCTEIEQLLNKSVNTSSYIKKLELCEKAYNLFIPIIEEFRGEKYYPNQYINCDFKKSKNAL
jgi:hypothetical protein